MINIYQLFVRLFGNQNTKIAFNGSKTDNGCGTFSDINDEALCSLKKLGITHIWLTGVIRHATQTSYKEYNIPESTPSIVKGKAGSPYAICDYYDVDPDLAVDPSARMAEFEQLVERIHNHDIKVIIDFIPNHLAREYRSIAKPENISDFGDHDQKNVAFGPNNNFYYIQNEKFTVPKEIAESQQYHEFPAKATGNNCFSSTPSVTDWYETIKLNYGTDFRTGQKHFSPIPDTWHKMLQILKFWSAKHIDGFRVDMAEMVPVEFWNWVIYELRKEFHTLLIAEIYQPTLYQSFIDAGFDYLYDKEGFYNTIERIYKYNQPAETISSSWQMLNGMDCQMLRFIENHDEIRLASSHFLGDASRAIPGFACAALMNLNPVMIYNGQEVGEKGLSETGFNGDNGRTTIFDYSIMPSHQKWMNNGKFDGAKLNNREKELREIYSKILNFRIKYKAFSDGAFYDLMWANPWFTNFDPQYNYAFLRYCSTEIFLVVVNFHSTEKRNIRVKIPIDAIGFMQLHLQKDFLSAVDILNPTENIYSTVDKLSDEGFNIKLNPNQVSVFKISILN